jgi:hypothetical protein
MKDIGKNKSISTFIQIPVYLKSPYEMICEFLENGKILIYGTFDRSHQLFLSDLERLIKDYVNPVIKQVKVFVEQNGFQLNLFDSFYDENIEVNNITYNTTIKINEKFQLKPFFSCINNVFNIESETSNLKKMDLLFKRVSHFNVLNSIDSFLLNKIKQNASMNFIVLDLIKNFPEFNRKSALERVKSLATQLQVESGYRKNRLDIKMNEGFKIMIEIDSFKSEMVIQVQNINNIFYLNTIPIYLDSLVRLTQDKTSTLFPITEIEKLCHLTKEEKPIITIKEKPEKPKEKKVKEPVKKSIKVHLKEKEPTKEPTEEPLKEPVTKQIKESLKEQIEEKEPQKEKEPIKEKEKESLKEPEKEKPKINNIFLNMLGNLDDESDEEEEERMGRRKKVIVS